MSSEPEPGGQRVEAGDAVGRLTRERDAALEAVCREQRRTVALTGLAHAVAGAHQVMDIARLVAASLPEVLSCDASAVWLWDPELGEIRAADTAGLTSELPSGAGLPARPARPARRAARGAAAACGRTTCLTTRARAPQGARCSSEQAPSHRSLSRRGPP